VLLDRLVVEAHEAGAKLRYFKSIDDLLASFATTHRSKRSHESLAGDERVRNAVAEALTSPITFVDFTMRLPDLTTPSSWAGAFNIESADV
jgi:ABC-type lipopolysaccharide export system ATPase subunit